MSERRLFAERTNLVMKDIKDQPAEKYVAIIETLGDRSAVSFAKFTSVNGVVILFASVPEGASMAVQKEGGQIVASFPVESTWTIVLRERFIEMTGSEWQEHKVKDGKSREEILEQFYGKDKLVKVIFTADGQQITTAATPEEQEAAKKNLAKAGMGQMATRPYDDSGLYR